MKLLNDPQILFTSLNSSFVHLFGKENMPKSKQERPAKLEKSADQSPPQESSSSSPEVIPGPQNMMESFERELQWCIDQLQLGLETQNPDSRQGVEAVKVLKILQSSKAPLVKKRQAMRNTFGDYRAKMKKEQAKSAAAAKKMKLASVEQTGYMKSQFFKKSSSQKSQTQSVQIPSASKDIDIETSETYIPVPGANLDESFKFNFSLTENVPTSVSVDNSIETARKSTNELGNSNDSEKDAGCSREGVFKMERSDNSFRFEFDMSDKT